MKSIKYLWGVALIALIIAISGYAHKAQLGDAGDINTIPVKFVQGLYSGKTNQLRLTNSGQVWNQFALATSSSGSTTFQSTDITNNATIVITPAIGAQTVTLPLGTAFASQFLPNVGDRTQIVIYNATTTATAIVTLAGNTGTKLANASTSAQIIPGGLGILNVIRTGTSSFTFSLVPSI